MSASQKDNWRELAEMLGLPSDAPAPPAVEPTLAAATGSLPGSSATESAARIFEDTPVQRSLGSADEPDLDLTIPIPEAALAEAEPNADAVADESEDVEEADEKPRGRGRRRGRR